MLPQVSKGFHSLLHLRYSDDLLREPTVPAIAFKRCNTYIQFLVRTHTSTVSTPFRLNSEMKGNKFFTVSPIANERGSVLQSKPFSRPQLNRTTLNVNLNNHNYECRVRLPYYLPLSTFLWRVELFPAPAHGSLLVPNEKLWTHFPNQIVKFVFSLIQAWSISSLEVSTYIKLNFNYCH